MPWESYRLEPPRPFSDCATARAGGQPEAGVYYFTDSIRQASPLFTKLKV